MQENRKESQKFIKNDQYFTVCVYTFVLVILCTIGIKAIISFDQTRAFFWRSDPGAGSVPDRPFDRVYFKPICKGGEQFPHQAFKKDKSEAYKRKSGVGGFHVYRISDRIGAIDHNTDLRAS